MNAASAAAGSPRQSSAWIWSRLRRPVRARTNTNGSPASTSGASSAPQAAPVLANLRRALRPGGHLYLTVELIDERELERAFAEAVASGLPVVRGEHTSRGGGYHYYPPLEQVATWVGEAGLEALEDGQGDDYYHLLTSGR